MSSTRSHIFICYAHAELELVIGDVEWLESQGYGTFRDDRIHPGSEWADELAEAIEGCAFLLFFASQKSVDSPHCRNEIAYAVDVDKPILTVFCEPLELHGGLKLTTARSQAIMRWHLPEREYKAQLSYAIDSVNSAQSMPVSHTTTGVWQVPLTRNKGFTGRESLLEALNAHFEHVDRATTLALTGPAGVGKTQTALEFAYRYGRGRDVVAWVRAEDNATLVADLVELAKSLGLAKTNEIDTPLVLDEVKHWLADHDNWLLVLDNVESPELMRRYLPEHPTGSVLVTTRRQSWGRLAATLAVDAFQEREAVSFLLNRSEEQDRESATALARALGNLPLALEEAAAYIETTGRTLNSYLRLFESHHDALMASSRPPDDYNQTLRTTLSVSLQKVQEEEGDAARLLQTLAFLAPDEVDLSMLSNLGVWQDNEDFPKELMVDRCISALRRFSLINVHHDAVTTHRLTQLVIRDSLSEAEFERNAVETLDFIAKLFPRVTSMGETADVCRMLLPHALTILTHNQNLSRAAVQRATLLGRVGTYMSARNLSSDASELMAEAYQLLRDLPDEKRKYARTCELYGRVLFNNGSLDHARQVFGEALPIFEAEGPQGLLHLMQINLDLSWVLWTKGDFAAAHTSATQSFDLMASVLGAEDPHTAISCSMICRLELELGNTPRALELAERVAPALSQIGQLDAEREPLLCAVYLQLAQVLRYLGAPMRAQSWAQESLRLGRNVYSEHHSLLGATHCVYGQAMLDLERFEDARREFEAAIECVDRHRFPINQHVIISECFLALTLTELGELDAAEKIVDSRLSRIERQIAGESGLTRAYAELARGHLACQTSHSEQAVTMCENGDQIVADTYGEHSLFRLVPLAIAANASMLAERYASAGDAHRLALKIAVENNLQEHLHCARHFEGLATIATIQDAPDEAAAYRKQALAIYQEKLGPSSPPAARLQSSVAGIPS